MTAEPHPWAANEPPQLGWLIRRLAELGGDRDSTLDHAYCIRFAVVRLLTRRLSACELIAGKLLPVGPRGPARELEELRRVARQAIRHNNLKPWWSAWARITDQTRTLVWYPEPRPVIESRIDADGNLRRDLAHRKVTIFGVPGLTMVAPRPDYALPLIQAAIKRLQSSAPKERRRRKGNSLVDALATTIHSAYVDLTGKPAPKAVLWGKPSLSSPLIQLARDIDRHFSLGVFHAADSRRLRKLTTSAH